jgi:predicted PurR-regulated permease PerM
MDSVSRTLITLAALALLAWVVWLVRDVLPPFVIAFALALLLDPARERLERRGLPRGAAVALLFAGFLALFLGVLAVVVPLAIAQVSDLLRNIDVYSARVQEAVSGWAAAHGDLLRRLNVPEPTNWQELWQRNQGEARRAAQVVLLGVFGALQASAGKLGWLIVIPITTLYLLLDLDRLRARLVYLIASEYRAAVLDVTTQIGRVFTAYLRGLVTICAAYGILVFLVLGLLFRLQYGLILGLAAAVLYAIPYIGQLALLVTCCVVAWASGHTAAYVIGVAVTLLLVGQSFDQFITPRFMGKQVGVHPVLGLFALMAGSQLFGLAGMVLAVPVAASIRVVLLELFPRLGAPLPEPRKMRQTEPVELPESPPP